MPGVMALAIHQVGRHQFVGRKTADRQQRAVHRQRRNDGVDARAVAQPRVDHRIRFVHAPAHLRDDLVDDAQQVLGIAEGDGGQFQQPFALDIDLLVGVDQNVGNAGILQKRFQRPQAENLVQYLVADLLLFERTEQRRFRIDQRYERLPHFAAHSLVVDGG